MKRVGPGLAVLLGFLGVVLSVALVLGLWLFNGKINRAIAGLIAPVETVVTAVDERLLALDERIQTLQNDTLAQLLAATTTLQESPPDIEIDTSPLIERIESKLEPAITTLRSELAALEPQISATLQLLSLAKAFLPPDIQTIIESNIDERVTIGTENLAAAQTKLQDLKADLSTLTFTTDIQRIERVEGALQELDAQLTAVATMLRGLETHTSSIQDAMPKLKRRIRLYLALATAAISLLALWAAWAQWALFKGGWQGFRQRSP